MNKTVTVIVPIYNVEKYLPKCLDSLLEQTHKELEVLAIIDGSPDNSAKIVKRYQKKDKRVKCIEKENGGYGSVLEYAINIIKSEYFIICDPDDWLKNNAIETLYKEARAKDLDIVVGDKYLVYNDNDSRKYCKSLNNLFYLENDKVYSGCEAAKIVNLEVSPHSKLYRTAICRGIDFPKKIGYTDFLLFVIASSRARRTLYINNAMSYYLVDRVGNTTTDKTKKALSAKITVLKTTIDILKHSKNNNKYIYYKLYNQIRYVIINFASEIKDESINNYIEDIQKLLWKIKEHKEDIKNTIYNKNIIKKMANKIILELLFSEKYSKITIKTLIKNKQ